MDIKLKGDLAELIVGYMFRASGYKIHRLGVEWIQPRLLHLITNRKIKFDGRIAQLSRIPDFAIEDSEMNKVDLVEVKYRQNGHLDFRNWGLLKEMDELWKPVLILLSVEPTYEVPEIKLLLPPYEVDAYGKPMASVDIKEQTLWRIKPEIIDECYWLMRIYGDPSNV